MKLSEEIRSSIFAVSGEDDFNELALKIFRYQCTFNPVYREMAQYLDVHPDKITGYMDVPFLPVSLFRDHKVISGEGPVVQKIFSSSGTTGSVPSKHFILDLGLYEDSFMRSFMAFYGNPESYRFLALLPGYLERQDSSLVYMMDYLIRLTENKGSGFYLHNLESLHHKLAEKFEGQTVLFGASFALLDFAEQFPVDLSDVIVMETGGMKGRRREMIREELHAIICSRLSVKVIHSEYGMTELLSQAYSSGNGLFHPPPWMKILIRDTHDPMSFLPMGQTGGINIIDLANLHSCSFISTQDLGRVHEDGSFEVLGRFDDSDIRGCNLLVV